MRAKGLKKCDYTIYMDMNDNDYVATLPKTGLKTRSYNMDMNKKDLKRLSKSQLIKLILKQEANKPSNSVNEHEEIIKPIMPPRTGKWESIKSKPVPRKSVNEDIILLTPEQFRDRQKKRRPPKPKRKPPPIPEPEPLNDFDDYIFQTENKIRQNKKFKSYTNEFKIKILKKLDDAKEIYHIFQELVKTVKRRRKLSDNDMLRLVIQNEELPDAISTKFNKVQDFKLGDLKNVINILEYRAIPIKRCKIVFQSVKIPTGKGRFYLSNDTVSRKRSIVTVKNDDTTCLARSIVMAMANLHPEKWTKTQLQDGFNRSRKLQKRQALKLHEEAQVEINDYGNNLSDIETFAKHLGIEINIIDAEQFNNIVYTANKGSEDKIYLLKTRNHFDVSKFLTPFYDSPYYCHECKKAYTKRDKHKCPSKCLSCFTYQKNGNAMVKKWSVSSTTRSSLVRDAFRITLKLDPRLRVKLISFAILSRSA